MEFICYTHWDELPKSADALFEAASKDSIFFSRPWFENLSRTVLTDKKPNLACVTEGDQILALLPLFQTDDGHWQPFIHLYSSLFTLWITTDNQDEIIQCLIHGLKQSGIKSLQLTPIAEDDPRVNKFQQALEQAGFESHRHFRFYNWIHKPQGQSFAEYMQARPGKVRNTVARKQRKLNREHETHIRLFTREDWQQGVTDYAYVYKASWKAHEQFDGFIDGLADTLSQQGWLRLAVLYIDNEPAAAQFWFVVHGKASIFKLAYDEKWRNYSPGSILITYLMEHVIDRDKVEEIDFLTGNDAYKQEWMSERRARWGLHCYLPTKPESTMTKLKKLFFQ